MVTGSLSITSKDPMGHCERKKQRDKQRPFAPLQASVVLYHPQARNGFRLVEPCLKPKYARKYARPRTPPFFQPLHKRKTTGLHCRNPVVYFAKTWRRGRDLNSWYLLSTHDFQSCSFGRSDTSPHEGCFLPKAVVISKPIFRSARRDGENYCQWGNKRPQRGG